MKKIIPGYFILIVLIFLLSGCEAFFTTSAFESLAKDPSDMTSAQLESYAENVIGSGDSTEMAQAFEALQDNLPADAADDPELYLLATDLAMGGSGLTDAITDVLPDVIEGNIDETFDYEEVLEGFDSELIADSVSLFSDVVAAAAEDDTIEISESQYVNAAVAQALDIINDAGGDLESIDDTDPATQAKLDLVEEWADLGGVDVSDYLQLPDDVET